MPPFVSIIIPCQNEVLTICEVLEAIGRQTFPSHEIETLVADGMSTDGTRAAIRSFFAEHPNANLKLVDNKKLTIPAALNQGIEVSQGEIVVRLDGHSKPSPDYVERCVSILQETGAANVGGRWIIKPSEESWIARSIAEAAGHPLGAGDARYRIGGQAGEVETVPFGAYPREWIDRVGPFNEELLTNEDYEYNLRLRDAGGVIWFDPSIQSTYYARPDLPSLLRQYIRYGYWKSQTLRLYPDSIRWRQTIPPLFVTALLGMFFAGLVAPLAWSLLASVLAIYMTVIVAAGAERAIHKREPRLTIGVPAALAVMHLSWGAAFLWGMIRPRVGRGSSIGQV